MKKYPAQDHKALATWAADCSEHVLPLFEKACSEDDRPRKAIETCRTWIVTGKFNMIAIRGASLSAHAAARAARKNIAACFAARSAGQAVATAHVPQHAFGASYYALKAICVNDSMNAEIQVAKELDWQVERAAKNLREEVLRRVVVRKVDNSIIVEIQKDESF